MLVHLQDIPIVMEILPAHTAINTVRRLVPLLLIPTATAIPRRLTRISMGKLSEHQQPILIVMETPRLPIRIAMGKASVLPPVIRIRMGTPLHNSVATTQIHLSGHGNL